jgi:hypothetical protein
VQKNIKVKNVNVKVSIFLIKHHCTKMYGGLHIWLNAFLIAILDGDERKSSRLGRFTSGEKAARIHWQGGW